MVLQKLLVTLVFIFINNALAEMEGHIVGGKFVEIEQYPHSAFLVVSCLSMIGSSWQCGASILSQRFTLTAAHCVIGCEIYGRISLTVGHEHINKGVISSADKYIAHSKYNKDKIRADIALVMMKTPFKLGPKIQRVAIMRNPPQVKIAYVAGWGIVDEDKRTSTNWLKHTSQTLWSNEMCKKFNERMPKGSICAGPISGTGYASSGDSGSALIIRGYIQIGIVSYKNPYISKSLVIYTDVSYYYDWISETMKHMYCG